MKNKRLSPREREIYIAILRGQTTKQIAAETCRSPKTVETQRQMMMEKLNCSSIAELFHHAYRNKDLEEALEESTS